MAQSVKVDDTRAKFVCLAFLGVQMVVFLAYWQLSHIFLTEILPILKSSFRKVDD